MDLYHGVALVVKRNESGSQVAASSFVIASPSQELADAAAYENAKKLGEREFGKFGWEVSHTKATLAEPYIITAAGYVKE